MLGHRSFVLGIIAVFGLSTGLACVDEVGDISFVGDGLEGSETASAPPPSDVPEHRQDGSHSQQLRADLCEYDGEGLLLVCSSESEYRPSCFVDLGGGRIRKETAQTFIAPVGGSPGKLRALLTLRNHPSPPPLEGVKWSIAVEIRPLEEDGTIPLSRSTAIAQGMLNVESCGLETSTPGLCLDYMEDLPVEVTFTWLEEFEAGRHYAVVFIIEDPADIALGIACHDDYDVYPDGNAHQRTTRIIGTDGSSTVFADSPFLAYNRDLFFSVSLLDGCEAGDQPSCGFGQCETTVPWCINSIPALCEDYMPDPELETCNGLDEDCDGIVDNVAPNSPEKLTRSCYRYDPLTRGIGECRDGFETCNAVVGSGVESWDGVCQGDVGPEPTDVCDGRDEDCDGYIDNATPGDPTKISKHCYTGPPGTEGVGECKGGLRYCDATIPGVESWEDTCVGEVTPGVEICDGLDNNCDGQIDEGNPGDGMGREGGAPCTVPGKLGMCALGTWQCLPGGKLTCVSLYEPTEEVCDGRDNDCDGYIDNIEFNKPGKLTKTCYGGPEGTAGVGECRAGIATCESEAAGVEGEAVWSSCVGEVLPTDEVCDGRDNNCDGHIDNNVDFPDDPSHKLTRSCYTGPEGTRGVGICHGGIETCNAEEAGVESWSACEGEQVPKVEVCNGFDNDCDGFVDNVPGLDEPLRVVCYTGPDGTQGVGECKTGFKQCTATPGSGVASYGACDGEVTPKREVCDGRDNDCDGHTDNQEYGEPEKIVEACYTGPPETRGVGICSDGWRQCNSEARGVTSWTNCADEVLPAPEVCDGLDNNCDGTVDESDPNEGGYCDTGGVGECGPGTRQCLGGNLVCVANHAPREETCNGKDDNCDGIVDNIAGTDQPLRRSCYTGPEGTKNIGECAEGYQLCMDGEYESTCRDEVLPRPEICDGLDNDCDGTTDDFSEACYTGPMGTEGVGECKGGVRRCAFRTWGVCEGEVLPGDELCDGKDNSCNGKTDTEDPELFLVLCEKQQGVCAGARKTINHCTNGSWDPCTDADYEAHAASLGLYYHPSAEICDGQDNNCNGQIDEPANLETVYCEKDKGVCLKSDGSRIRKPASLCTGEGGWAACGDDIYAANAADQWGSPGGGNPYHPTIEYCDGLDNNCDGSVDEVAALETVQCENQKGVCSGSTKPKSLCVGGGWQACGSAEYKAHSSFYEVVENVNHCDGRDNDCDGYTDNAVPNSAAKLSRVCYTGPAGTRGKGVCKDGNQQCQVTTIGVEKWGNCVGEVTPAAQEICDGLDNTCNGLTDAEDPAMVIPNCEKTKGVCAGSKKPTNLCQGDRGWAACADTHYTAYADSKGWTYHPTKEFCDNQDNNCDGRVDEVSALEQVLCQNPVGGGSTLYGVCAGAVRPAARCQAGAWQPCTTADFQAHTPHYRVSETVGECDGLDNDCDGRVDNVKGSNSDLSKACWSVPPAQRNVGECRDGTSVCQAQTSLNGQPNPEVWSSCQGEVTPKPEICDGKDNDCDGRADNNPGTSNNLTESCYTGPPNTVNRGICKPGTRTCSQATWGSCAGEVTPKPEVCNGLDDNCDGVVDNNSNWQQLCPELNKAGVAGAACDSSAKRCYATSCSGNYFYSGGSIAASNNCACEDGDGFGSSCGAPTAVGSFGVTTTHNRSGRVKIKHGGAVDASGGTANSDFFKVTFNVANEGSPSGKKRMRGSPSVRLVKNPGNAFRLRIRPGNSCSGMQRCNSVKNSPVRAGFSAPKLAENITAWTHSDNCGFSSGTANVNNCTSIAYTPTSGATRPQTGAWDINVEVYRVSSANACEEYTVRFDYFEDADPEDNPPASCTTSATLYTSGTTANANLNYNTTLYSKTRIRGGHQRINDIENVPLASATDFAQYANQHWYRANLPPNTLDNRSGRFGNLGIRLPTNGGDAYRFLVLATDNGSQHCTTKFRSAQSTACASDAGLTVFQWTCAINNGCANGAQHLPASLYIKVFRKAKVTTGAISANTYRLEVKRTARGVSP